MNFDFIVAIVIIALIAIVIIAMIYASNEAETTVFCNKIRHEVESKIRSEYVEKFNDLEKFYDYRIDSFAKKDWLRDHPMVSCKDGRYLFQGGVPFALESDDIFDINEKYKNILQAYELGVDRE